MNTDYVKPLSNISAKTAFSLQNIVKDYVSRGGTKVRALDDVSLDAPAGGIAADSLAPKRVGELMFPIAREFVSVVVLVTDEAIVEAQRTLWDKVRIAAEPGGAAALAALLSGRYLPAPGERVGVVVCGGNTDAVDMGRKR